jgi:hypothetical protein
MKYIEIQKEIDEISSKQVKLCNKLLELSKRELTILKETVIKQYQLINEYESIEIQQQIRELQKDKEEEEEEIQEGIGGEIYCILDHSETIIQINETKDKQDIYKKIKIIIEKLKDKYKELSWDFFNELSKETKKLRSS